jgi:hypothetical protein
MDIFSGKACFYPMKSKSLSDTTPAVSKGFSTLPDYMNLIVKHGSLL